MLPRFFSGILSVTHFMCTYSFLQECIPVGCVPSAAVAILGGGFCLWGGGLPAREECLPARGCLPRRGVCLPWGSGCQGGCTPPHSGKTDTCENITFPQLLLRTVKMSLHHIPLCDGVHFEFIPLKCLLVMLSVWYKNLIKYFLIPLKIEA